MQKEIQQSEPQQQEEIQDINTTVVPEVSNPSGNRTKIIFLFSAIIIIVVGVLVWQYWPEKVSQDLVKNGQPVVEEEVLTPTAEEGIVKTNSYQNSKANFQIEYPKGWFIVEDSEQENPVSNSELKKEYRLLISNSQSNPLGSFTSRDKNTFGVAFVSYLIPKEDAIFVKGGLLEDELFMLKLQYGTLKKIIRDGVEGYRGIKFVNFKKGKVEMSIAEFFLDNNGEGLYSITGHAIDNTEQIIYQEQVEKIISSFRFLE